jgi:GNAT superfamily N-acetyltransferase
VISQSARSYDIRRATAADEPLIREVLQTLLPGEDLDARLRWLYHANTGSGGEAVAWLAVDKESGAPAGITTFFLRRMQVKGERVIGALGGDMFVMPNFRRRGIGKELFLAARDEMGGLGIEVMFGTPMPANETPLKTSGSALDARAVRYARALTGKALHLPGPLGALATSFLRGRSRLRLEPSPPGDPRIDALWQRVRGELAIATVRDTAFYRWRFHEAPSHRQRPYVIVDGEQALAACALEDMGDRVRIIDLLAETRDWPEALGAIAAHCQGKDVLEIKLAREDAQRRGIWKQGFLARDDKPISVLTPPGSSRERAFHDPPAWFFTWADADTDRAL